LNAVKRKVKTGNLSAEEQNNWIEIQKGS